jgi:ribonuclease J
VSDQPTRIVFLGGLGEVGRNIFAVESKGRILIIDAGLSFPNEDMLGVDLVLPDFSYLTERADRCEAVVLTHGHEDHVGALGWLLKEIDVPVYGTPLTLGIASRRLEEHGIEANMTRISAPGRLEIGPFTCHFIAMSHSIPDAIAVAIDTDDGRILYTGDFKLDSSPIDGRVTDIDTLKRLGEEGVDLMLSDSTNAEVPGRTPSERAVGDTLNDLVSKARKRVIVACFASNLHRIQQVCSAAESSRRRVAFVGRSMVANVEVGRELGHLQIGYGTQVDLKDLLELPPERAVIVCTGSQGEPFSALSLIAAGEHKEVKIEAGDTVILSASPIPGNEAAVHSVINQFYRSGAEVFHSGASRVHVSGHAASDELAELLTVVRPRNFVPVHGEFRHLAAHAHIAREVGLPEEAISIAEDGVVLELNDGKLSRGEKVQVGTVLVDGLGVGDVGPVVLRDRRLLAEDGIVICVVTIDGHTGEILAGPDIISRGFVYEDEARDLLDEASDTVRVALEQLEAEGVTDWAAIKKKTRRALGEFVWTRTRRRPVIMPLVVEI